MTLKLKMYMFIFAVPLVGALVIAPALLIAHSKQDPTPARMTAEAVLVSPGGREMGTVTFTQWPRGVILSAEVQGLAPGGHAFSINSVAACTPNFEAAGGQFNPHKNNRGLLSGGGPQAVDLPNIYAGGDGTARADFVATENILGSDPDHSIFDKDGSSIIIYEKPDTYFSETDLGDRIACGVIRRN